MLGRLTRWLTDSFSRNNRSRLLSDEPPLLSGSEWQPEESKQTRRRSRSRKLLDAVGHFTGLSSLSATISTGFNWTAQNNLTGGVYNPITNTGNISKSYKVATTSANNVSGGGDEVFSFQQAIVAGSSATVDLDAMTNLLNQTSVAIVRIKGAQIRLLSAADDSTITPAPNAASTITVTNIGPAVPSPFTFGNGGSGGTVTLTVSNGAVTGVAVGSGGSGYPVSGSFLSSPQQTGGSGCVFLSTANSGGVISSVTFISGQGGAGYSGATVPLIPVGQKNILTGGASMYFDVGAAGFCAVSSTSRNLKIINMDQTNAVTAEIDILGATS